MPHKLYSLDLFSGCGGLTLGMKKAGFKTKIAIDNNLSAVKAFELNHPKTKVIKEDISQIKMSYIKDILGKSTLHLLAGCPPCQGFSTIRRLNRKESIKDDRNDLILEYLRFVKELKPLTIMMENVPGLQEYHLFQEVVGELTKLGYNPKVEIINVKDYGIPQSRKRLVMVGSILGNIQVARPTGERKTVRDAIYKLEPVESSNDFMHRLVADHDLRILEMIKKVPKNGGSRKDLPEGYILKCHEKDGIGFKDVYGRLRWDDYSTTITGGCLNPSKGRFLHPEYDRVISAREAALLQTFPAKYKFPENVSKSELALMIGNALPPKFSYIQSLNIKKHIEKFLNPQPTSILQR